VTGIGPDSVVKLSNEQISADLSGTAVVLNIAAGVYYKLNEVGALVWKQLEGGARPVHELVAAVMSEYAVDRERCQADVVVLLEDLRKRGLIEVAESDV
jgi:hypothetical protein